jgi:serpin B
MPTQRTIASLVCLVLVATSSSDAAAAPSKAVGAAAACNRFAFDLLGKLPASGNLIVSPLSAETALAMTAAGARGATLAEMKRTLHLAQVADPNAAMGKLLADLNALDGKQGLALRVANRIWARKGIVIEPAFAKLTSERFHAPIATADFANDAEGARKRINAWVSEQTRKMIQELLQRGVIVAGTPMVLVNAVYMKGQWAAAFEVKSTVGGDFHTGAGTVKAKLMSRTGPYRYAHADGVQILELPYKGGLSMVVFLPDARDGIGALRAKIGARYNEWVALLSEQKVNLSLPRFKARTRRRLESDLMALGMKLAFGKADFSGITRTLPLSISAVIHEAVIEVNEEGTKAAAATAVVMRGTGMPRPIPTVRADHPFLYVLRDPSSGVILFVGRVANPTVE